jgi:hypothetical protein
VSKDQLVDHLCGWGEEVSHNAIEVYIHRLRKKLEATRGDIITVRGLGYCLEKPAEETDPDAQRSLFGEILDWMLAPLLFVWPISIAFTHYFATSVASFPYDQSLREQVMAIARQVKFRRRATADCTAGMRPRLPAIGRDRQRLLSSCSMSTAR